MDISQFKDVIRRVNVFKDYSSLLVPAVIGLVGGLLFIPTQLMSSKLKKQMTAKSVAQLKDVKSFSYKAVARGQWKEEQKYQQEYANDANQIAFFARQSAQRQLLSYQVFPEPKEDSPRIFEKFGEQFRSAVDDRIRRINARDCPTEAELQRILESSSGALPSVGRSYQPLRSEINVEIVNALCQQKAESASVYANSADLSGYEFWGKPEDKSDQSVRYKYTTRDEAVTACWYWQLAYWIIEDVIDTADVLNSRSNTVFTSPVKRLLWVSYAPHNLSGGSVRSGEKMVDMPKYVFSIKEGLTEPWTGRVCDDNIDVVHFNVAVVVSRKAVSRFMRELCSAKEHKFRGWDGKGQEQTFKHNQITILASNITSIEHGGEIYGLYDSADSMRRGVGGVDQQQESHALYRYGEDAVVKLDLICEYVFDKKGFFLDKKGSKQIKPNSITELLKKAQGLAGGQETQPDRERYW